VTVTAARQVKVLNASHTQHKHLLGACNNVPLCRLHGTAASSAITASCGCSPIADETTLVKAVASVSLHCACTVLQVLPLKALRTQGAKQENESLLP
jgi:hypothetical protein